MFAARLWWMLRWLGHAEVAMLDGGFRRWKHLDLPLVADVPQPRRRHVRRRRAPRADGRRRRRAGVGCRPGAKGRRRARRRALSRRRRADRPRSPATCRAPATTRRHRCLGASGCFLPADELRAALLRSLDGVGAERTIAYCGSGVTACHMLLAMEHAGLRGGRLYPGSWSEWSRNPARPVARGAEP